MMAIHGHFRLQPVFGPAFMPGLRVAATLSLSISLPLSGPFTGLLPPCRYATAKIIDRLDQITELETALLGRNPVNGVDSANSAKQRFHAIPLTRHECRAEYRLKPKTGVNARASCPYAEQKRHHDFRRISRVLRRPVPPYKLIPDIICEIDH